MPDAVSAAEAPRGASLRGTFVPLIVLCGAEFLVLLDATVVNIALPRIESDLDFSARGLQWVITSYVLAFGGFLLVGGRLADLRGRKELFLTGCVIFVGASLMCGVAWSPTALVVFRTLEGLGGALLLPAALALATSLHPDEELRARALGIWGAVAATGGAAGLVIGGLVADALSWRWIFLINVPCGAVIIAAAVRRLPRLPAAAAPGASAEVAGAVCATGGLIAVVYGVVRVGGEGWSDGQTPVVFGLAAFLLAAFVLVERGREAPLIPFSVLRRRDVVMANMLVVLMAASLFGVFYFASLYAQRILDYSSLVAGLALLPATLAIAVGSAAASPVVARLGIRAGMLAGIALSVLGLGLLLRLSVPGSYVSELLPGIIPVYAGMGLSFVPLTMLAMGSAGDQEDGLLAGVFTTAQQVAGAIGLAVVVSVAATVTNNGLRAGDTSDSALVDGYHAGLALSLGLAVLALVLACFARRGAAAEEEAL